MTTFTFDSTKPAVTVPASADRIAIGDESGGSYTFSWVTAGAYFASPLPIGSTTANTGAFTTLTTSNDFSAEVINGTSVFSDKSANRVTINPDGVDIDFYVETENVNNAIHVDASADKVDFNVLTDFNSGISFDAGVTTLDTYAEGTWTPTYIDANATSTITISVQNGEYTRVGNLVTCHGTIRTSSVTIVGTGALTIGGLPFPAKNTPSVNYSGSIGKSQGFSSTTCPASIQVIENTQTARLLLQKSGDPRNELDIELTVAGMGASTNTLEFSFSYLTA